MGWEKHMDQNGLRPRHVAAVSSVFGVALLIAAWLVLNGTAVAGAAAPTQGPGGPILVVTTANNPFSLYYAEILRTEGFNAFAVSDISSMSATTLAAYDVVILGQMPLTATQVTMFSNWVNAGGQLIAMRPDKQLAGLLGLTDASSTLANAYLLVNTATGPGVGIVAETIQFHGTADLYALSGALSIATLYANATTATANPAVTLRGVGTNGGQAAAFTYDLARSVVYTRQGNPAWSGQERDGIAPIRSDDLYYGAASGDPQPDWVDLTKVAIPQADEQQRLLANLILQMNLPKKPLPRFWYFPQGFQAVVIMTGDDHGIGGTAGRFDQYLAASPAGCSVADWHCIRSTSYIYPGSPLTDAQAAAYVAQGFEVALHVTTGCADWTPASLRSFYSDQLSTFAADYPSVPPPATNRTHCIAWSDYATQPQVEIENGIRLDTSYYYWPPSWLADRPGFFTGSGMPMRFAGLDGTLIDVYQAATQLTDESGQTYPYEIAALLDNALGPQGYYGAFTANMHTDLVNSTGSDAIIAAAQARSVPVVSARQMLTWLDGRNSSSFGALGWNTNVLSFTITVGTGATGLEGMVPMKAAVGDLTGITRNGSPIMYTSQVIKGITYAFFPAAAGTYQATYAADTTPPTISATSVPNGATGVDPNASLAITFSEAMDPSTINASTIQLRDASGNLVSATVTYDAATRTATLHASASLAYSTTYTLTIMGGANGVKDLGGNPLAADATSSFTTAAPPPCPCSLWSNATTPGVPAANDPNGVELGVKFRTSVNGYITGVRFYKGATNTGTHVGNLWTSSGTLLVSATFTDETTSGWQQVSFPSPVAVTANTTYVASYHTTTGNYAVDTQYFATAGFANPPLQALQNGVNGGNGVYAYGAGGFPAQTYNASNYWVDVVFVLPDTTPPTVSAVAPASGATGVSAGTVVKATFSKAMDPMTITTTTFQLRNAANALVAASVSYDGTTLTATLTPSSALGGGTTYTATVKGGATGVKDLAGNALAADVSWSFTTVASFTDTTVADFSAGTLDVNTYIAQTINGEVLLAPSVGAEFFGTALPAGWTSTAWSTGGTASVANGVLTVDGARGGTAALFGSGRSLEFVATFSGEANQHVGFGVDFNNPPWAIFSTRNGGNLSARTRVGSNNINTQLGSSWLGAPHRYRIDWNASSIVYSIDGTVVATHTATITNSMRPLASDFTLGGGRAVVDWLRMTPYATSGSFLSRVFDGGRTVTWGRAAWTGDVPTGTSLVIRVRMGNTATPDSTWTAFSTLSSSGATIGGSSRYIQYQAQLATTAPGQTPALRDITIGY
jgi:Domain of unknown function (DUF4082)/Bacterial Ig-like domain/Glycosyl hydrolases family 16